MRLGCNGIESAGVKNRCHSIVSLLNHTKMFVYKSVMRETKWSKFIAHGIKCAA